MSGKPMHLEVRIEQPGLGTWARWPLEPRLHDFAACQGHLHPVVRIILWKLPALLVDRIVVDPFGRPRRLELAVQLAP